MTTEADILNRPPAMKPLKRAEPEYDTSDWRGEHHWHVPRQPYAEANKPKVPRLNATQQRVVDRDNRREKLRGMVGKGQTETDLAATLGCSRTCIRADLKALGLKA